MPLARSKARKGTISKDINPLSVLKCAEKSVNAALLIQRRCNACHGKTVRDVLGSMVNNGNRYTMADLRYDIKHGRLELCPPGTSTGCAPAEKCRTDAPCAGEPLPPASTEEFFKFCQCQLRFEANLHTNNDVPLEDAEAMEMWPWVQAFATPNLGATERYVPYHTILGVHEHFLVESVHHRKEWDERQRFLAMFVFRAHCKRDLFTQAQLPLMLKASFWKDPIAAFKPGGPMEKSIRQYRKKTGKPLLTSCFRIIPERLLKDDDENLVRSITNRSMRLLEVAGGAFVTLKDKKLKPAQKFAAISSAVQEAQGLGETWAKMLTVCVDLGWPEERLLASQCDVGTGALGPLRCLLENGGPRDRREALVTLLQEANSSQSPSTKHFWAVLKSVEKMLRAKYKNLPLICKQANTKEGNMSAATLQVQLCEYRQFRHSLARNKYGLADDESMREEFDKETTLRAEDFVDYDAKSNCVLFDFPKDDKKVRIVVPVKTVKSVKVAERVGCLCFAKMKEGCTKEETEKFRDDLVRGYTGGDDVPDDSEAWEECAATVAHRNPLVSFRYGDSPFQTTMAAAGGLLQAERVARLCWAKFQQGANKEEVQNYRNDLYRKINPGGTRPRGQQDPQENPAKRRRTK